MQEMWVWSLGQEDPLEQEMATHSRILAWKNPWTEEPGRLQSMGLLIVGHDWATDWAYTQLYWTTCPSLLKYIYTYVYMYTYVHILKLYVCMYSCVHICVYTQCIYIYAHTYIYAYIYICIYIYTHMHWVRIVSSFTYIFLIFNKIQYPTHGSYWISFGWIHEWIKKSNDRMKSF